MKLRHKTLSLLVSFGMLLGTTPMMVFAENPTPVSAWTGQEAQNFESGDGSEQNPYQIATAEQLAKITFDVNTGKTEYAGKYFKLTNNIDLSGHSWTPIGYSYLGYSNRAFRGFLDGNYKTISHLKISGIKDQTMGLFGYIANHNSNHKVGVKNLTIADATINGELTNQGHAGILAGKTVSGSQCTIEFDNISVSGSINFTSPNESMWQDGVGGMFGKAFGITAKNCKAENVSISGVSDAGGIVGYSYHSTYTNCSASGQIDGGFALGGFVAASYTQSKYEKCFTNVDVVTAEYRVGGFVGITEDSEYNKCIALGDVTSNYTKQQRVGGFVGESGIQDETGHKIIMNDCHAAGTITSATPKAGGLIGYYVEGTYDDCSFDQEKNPSLTAIGNTVQGTNVNVVGADSENVLGQFCDDILNEHDYATDWTTDLEPTCAREGSKSHHCKRCGKKTDITSIPKVDHEYTWVIEKEPTKDQAGSKYQYCVNCHHKKDPVFIPAIGSTEKVENAVYRAYNPNNGEHLYTTDYKEFMHITNNGWHDEGVAFMAEEEQNGQALYRVYNPNSGLHHYTLDEKEKNTLVSLGWHDEKVAWYTSKKPQSAPVFRVYNPNDGNHHYTMNKQEKDVLVSLGWQDEGLAFRTAPIEK